MASLRNLSVLKEDCRLEVFKYLSFEDAIALNKITLIFHNVIVYTLRRGYVFETKFFDSNTRMFGNFWMKSHQP